MHHKTVIVGAGTAGIALQHRLCRYFNQKSAVGVIEPSDTHYYQPLWTLVGGGKKSLLETGRPMETLMHKNVEWYQDRLAKFEPENNKVVLDSGYELNYDNLIVATGIKLNFNAIKGLEEGLKGDISNGICSNYDKNTVLRTWENIQRLAEDAKNLDNSSPKLQAIFTQPPMPIKCAGAPQKIMYLAHEYWKNEKVLDKIEITFCTAMPGIFSQPDYAAALRQVCKEKGIKNIEYENNLLEIDETSKTAIFSKNSKQFDMIHVTPVQCAPDVCKNSDLSNETGFIDVNPKTLKSTKFNNVWALGDCSSVPTSKTAAAVAGQNEVLFKNLVNSIEGDNDPVALYDGYTSCPLVVGDDKCIMAEFDYKLKKKETMWYDQSEPSRLSYHVKAEKLPELYWRLHCTGNWGGPGPVRDVFAAMKNWLKY